VGCRVAGEGHLYPKNWAATVGLAVLHARAEEIDTAKKLLAEALQRGGEEVRATAAGFPILKELLGKQGRSDRRAGSLLRPIARPRWLVFLPRSSANKAP